MYIEKYKQKYRAVECYTDPMTGKQKRVTLVLEKDTKMERRRAEKVLHEKIESLIGATASDSVRFGLLVDRWVKHSQAIYKPSTWSRNARQGQILIRILGSDTLVSKLSSRYITERLMDDNPTPSTVNERLTRLKAIIRWGYNNDYVSDINFLDKLHPLPDQERKWKASSKYLESQELQILLDNMKVERWHDLTEFLALTGIRVGEAFALTTDDISNDCISVTKTYDPINQVFTSTKTESSCRDVSIQTELKPLCQKLVAQKNDRVFLQHPADYYTYTKYIRENAQNALGRPISPHVLRHTHVALLAENGVPLDVISRRLGHKDSSITRDVYFHVTNKLRQRDTELLSSISLLTHI